MEPGSNARAVTIIFTFVILRTSCGLSLPLQMFAWFGWQSDGPGQCQAQSSPGMLSGFVVSFNVTVSVGVAGYSISSRLS